MKSRKGSSERKLTVAFSRGLHSDWNPEKGYIAEQQTRMDFPKRGDSSFFSKAGRMHFKKKDEAMLRIILPERYALDSPKDIKRQQSLSPPHLQHNFSEFSPMVLKSPRDNGNENIKESTLRGKVYDELDKIKAEYQQAKNSPRHIQCNSPQVIASNFNRQTIENNDQPFLSYGSTKLPKQSSLLLYRAQNKQRYDDRARHRSINPTHLSTGPIM